MHVRFPALVAAALLLQALIPSAGVAGVETEVIHFTHGTEEIQGVLSDLPAGDDAGLLLREALRRLAGAAA